MDAKRARLLPGPFQKDEADVGVSLPPVQSGTLAFLDWVRSRQGSQTVKKEKEKQAKTPPKITVQYIGKTTHVHTCPHAQPKGRTASDNV